MDQRKIDFGSLEWQTPLPGARYKAFQRDGQQLRLVEFRKGFIEPDWCVKGHIGYVLEGEMELDFDGEIVQLRAGDGLMIPPGEADRHKGTVISDVVKVILVEDLEQGD